MEQIRSEQNIEKCVITDEWRRQALQAPQRQLWALDALAIDCFYEIFYVGGPAISNQTLTILAPIRISGFLNQEYVLHIVFEIIYMIILFLLLVTHEYITVLLICMKFIICKLVNCYLLLPRIQTSGPLLHFWRKFGTDMIHYVTAARG